MLCVLYSRLRKKHSGGATGSYWSWAGARGSGLWLWKDLGEGVSWKTPSDCPVCGEKDGGAGESLDSLTFKATGVDEMTQGAE